MIEEGDGSWQRLLEQDRCPKCKSLMTKLMDGDVRVRRECLVCNLIINEGIGDKNEQG